MPFQLSTSVQSNIAYTQLQLFQNLNAGTKRIFLAYNQLATMILTSYSLIDME
jgi:hypothetical protein